MSNDNNNQQALEETALSRMRIKLTRYSSASIAFYKNKKKNDFLFSLK